MRKNKLEIEDYEEENFDTPIDEDVEDDDMDEEEGSYRDLRLHN